MAVTIGSFGVEPGPTGAGGASVGLIAQASSDLPGRLRMSWVREGTPGDPVELWPEFPPPARADGANGEALFDGTVNAFEAPQVQLWIVLGDGDGRYALRAVAGEDAEEVVAHSDPVELAATYEITIGPLEVIPPSPEFGAPVVLRADVARSSPGVMAARWVDRLSGEILGELPETPFDAGVAQVVEGGLVNDPMSAREVLLVVSQAAGVLEPALASEVVLFPLQPGLPGGIALLEAGVQPPSPVAPGTELTLNARVLADSGELWAAWTRLEEGMYLPVGAPVIVSGAPGEHTVEARTIAAETSTYRLAAGRDEADAYGTPPLFEVIVEVSRSGGNGRLGRRLWRRTTTLGPGPIAGHAMALDADRGRLVLHGGRRPDGAAGTGTWEWIDGFWVQVSGLAAPGAARGALAYDHERGAVVLHGGGDTFEWDGEVWSQVAEDGPTGTVLCDGRGAVTLITRADPASATWAWDGAAWTELDEGSLTLCGGFSATFVPGRDVVVVAGGVRDDGVFDDITWEWDGSVWVERSRFGPIRWVPLLCAAGETAVLFGGSEGPAPDAALLDDTWHWDGRLWTQRLGFGAPPRGQAAIATDPEGRPVVVGGVGADGRLLDDTWAYGPLAAEMAVTR